MNEASALSSHLTLAQELMVNNASAAEIEKRLSEAGYSADEIAAALDHLQRSRRQGLSKMGAILIGLGVLMCIGGFAVLITSTDQGMSFNIALYGLTGTGGTSIVGGMALILG